MKFFSSEKDVLKAALFYASNGIKVFPCHFYLNDDGKAGSFSPVNQHGYKAASSDPAQIEKWWASFPDALIGMPCGSETGILALTAANSKYTAETLYFYDHTCKKVFLFKYPTNGPRPTCGKIKEGVFAGEGSYIVLPPSAFALKNTNGTHGKWVACNENIEIAEVPAELLEKMCAVGSIEEVAPQVEAKEAQVVEAAKIEAKVEAQAVEAEVVQEEIDTLPALPLDCLPEKLREIIEGSAKAFCVTPWLPFAAILKSVSTIVGANAMLQYKKRRIAGHLWLCLIGESSCGKTEICDFFKKKIHFRQKYYCDSYEKALEEYKDALQKYEQDKAQGLKEGREPQFKKPVQPAKTTLYVDDVTPESLIMILKDNPGGVMWECDEIRGLLASFSRYGNSDSGEAAKNRLLSMYTGKPIKLDRKGAEATRMIDQGWLSIFGTTQPQILPKLFSKEDMSSGFLQRFVLIHAERTTPVDSGYKPEIEDFESDVEKIFSEMIEQIQRLSPDEPDVKTLIVDIDKAGVKKIDEFCDEIVRQAYYLTEDSEDGEDERARAGRWCEQVPRLVLILHALERCCNYGQISNCVSLKTVENAIKIFKALQGHSVYCWNRIRGKKIKKAKKTDICSIIDKYIEKTGDIYELKYPETIADGTKVVDAVLNELGAAEASLSTRQALTKALESQGFTKKMYNKGTKFIIPKGVYEKNLSNATMATAIKVKKRIDDNDFFAEIKNGMENSVF